MSWNHDWNAFNKGVVEQFRANGGQVPGRKYPLILLTTTGAKSGLPRTTPLNYSTDDDRIIVIASKAAATAALSRCNGFKTEIAVVAETSHLYV